MVEWLDLRYDWRCLDWHCLWDPDFETYLWYCLLSEDA